MFVRKRVFRMYMYQDTEADNYMHNKKRMLQISMILMLLTAIWPDGRQENGVKAEAAAQSEVKAMSQTVTDVNTGITAGQMKVKNMKKSMPPSYNKYFWLDRALAECLGTHPRFLTEEDYLSVEKLFIHGGEQTKTGTDNYVRFTWDGAQGEVYILSDEFPEQIDISDIVKYENLEMLRIWYDKPHSEPYLAHYEELGKLRRLSNLCIWLRSFTFDSKYTVITDTIDDLSFMNDLPELTRVEFYCVNLPDDLSPFFSHHFIWVNLDNCNITEKAFAGLDQNSIYPDSLSLRNNRISDASAIMDIYGNWGENTVYSLDLSWNPLTKLGDIPSGFGDFDPMKSDQSGIGLYLEGTDFDEYTFQWLRD